MASGDRNRLTVRGPGGVVFGYGRMVASFKEVLSNKVELVDDALTCVDMTQPNLVKGWLDGQHKVVFTMWETSKLPHEFHEPLPQYDQVLVPCQHNKELFGQHHDNVKVVPLGVDTKFWVPAPAPVNDVVTFLAGGSHWMRKGLDKVVEAWERLNPAGARLILKCTPETVGGIGKITSPTITVIDEFLSMTEERDLYRSVDCFISGSRGEGWGLMPLQAMCSAIPVLMTDTTGHREFSNYACRLIDTTPESASEPRFYNIGEWDTPLVGSIMDAVTWFMDNRDEAKQVALTNRPKVAKFTWANATKHLLESVPLSSGQVTGKWVGSDELFVEVTALRKIDATIGAHTVRLRKGEMGMVSLNSRDVLKASGAIA